MLRCAAYTLVNPGYKRHAAMSRAEFTAMPKSTDAIFLSFCEGQHLLCMNMLRNIKPSDCDNYLWELSQTVFKSLPAYHEKNLTALQNLFGEMFKRFTTNRHRVSHRIKGLLDVNERILVYGDKTHQKSEAELLAKTWLKLKTWYGSVPKYKQTALADEWALFVKQKPLLGTTRENFIDPRFTEAYSDAGSVVECRVGAEERLHAP